MIGGYQANFPPREYDTAQICLNGHLINSFASTKPNRNKKYCVRCGEATFTHCPSCNAPIQGYHHGLRGPSKYTIPKYCYECSNMYPWTKVRFDAIPNCVYWCRASKYGNAAWLPYGHKRTGNHQAKCEVSRVLLTNQRMRAEKSQAVMRKGQKTHKNTPPPEPALKADCLLTSKY